MLLRPGQKHADVEGAGLFRGTGFDLQNLDGELPARQLACSRIGFICSKSLAPAML